MFTVRLRLDRMHCHTEEDSFGSSEPYLWSVFFYADINTVLLGPGNRLATYTPLSSFSTRDLYPDGVEAGEDVDIPSSLGRHNVILDDGGMGAAVAGVLFLLLEEDQTPGYAIVAGHQALAEATDAVLNDFVDSVFPDTRKPEPDEIQTMADEIQTEVTDAIKSELSWYHFLHNQDDFFGFGYQFYPYEQLKALASSTGTEPFSASIHHERKVVFPNGPTTNIVNDYEIFGSVSVREYSPPPDPCQRALESYDDAVNALKTIDDTIDRTVKELQKASGAEKEALREELKYLQDTIRPPAADGIGSARAAYEDCRGHISTHSADYLEQKAKLRKAREDRKTRIKPSRFRQTAVIASIRS